MPSFFDRLLGRHDPRPTAGEEPDRNEDLAEPAGERTYLEFVGGTSAKFYAVVLYGNEDDGWTVAFNFGRIGHPREWATKIEETDEDEARGAYDAVIDEKQRGGYEPRAWPGSLAMPDGAGEWRDEADEHEPSGMPTRYVTTTLGSLPAPTGAIVAGVELPDGVLLSPEESEEAVIWMSTMPIDGVDVVWRRLAAAFGETGLWPLIMELGIEPARMGEIFREQDNPMGGGARAILAHWWSESLGIGDDFDPEVPAPFGRRFPGLAPPASGDNPVSLNDRVAGLGGHLGLVSVRRPADVLEVTGWTGAANYDANPADQSTVLRSWEERFDAYIIGLGWDTVLVAVGRPPRNGAAATRIAAEHMAFCLDNIEQGVGYLSEYSESLVNAPIWPFWWD